MAENHESVHHGAELMYIICAHCGIWVDVKPGRLHHISHGICADCYDRALRDLDALDEGEA